MQYLSGIIPASPNTHLCHAGVQVGVTHPLAGLPHIGHLQSSKKTKAAGWEGGRGVLEGKERRG